MDRFNIISSFLDTYRKKLALNRLAYSIVILLISSIIAFFLLLSLEGVLYFSPKVKTILILSLVILFSAALLYCVIVYLFSISGRWMGYSDLAIAELINLRNKKIGQRLINAIQLRSGNEEKKSSFSLALINLYIKNAAELIKQVNINDFVSRKFLTRAIVFGSISIIIISLIFMINTHFYINAGYRLLSINREFEPTLPFQICSETGSITVLTGDTIRLRFKIRGILPDRIWLKLKNRDGESVENIKVGDSVISYELRNLRKSFLYEAFAKNTNIFKSWDMITSGLDTINVITRPEVLKYAFTIEPPDYTRLGDLTVEPSIPEIKAYPGSRIRLHIVTNKDISNGFIIFESGINRKLNVNGREGNGTFHVYKPDNFIVRVFDNQGNPNISPIKYRLVVLNDEYPMVSIVSPTEEFELGENLIVPIIMRISDDFGFSKLNLVYHFLNKLEQFDTFRVEYPIADKNLTLQQITYRWDVSELNIVPGQELELWAEVFDNDIISGPKKSVSGKIKIRYPTIVELFSQVSETEDEIISQTDEVLRQLRESKKVLDEISLKLIKEDEVKWERKSQIEREIERTKELAEKVKKVSEKIDEIIKKGEDNLLFSEEVISKLVELQRTFSEIMTPELREAIEKLQKSIENLNKDEIMKALDNFKINQEQFERELDRMLNIMKRVKIEQAVDEMVKRINELIERQSKVNEELKNVDSLDLSDIKRLFNEEEKINYDMENLHDLMRETIEDMSNFPMMPSKELSNILDEFEKMDISSDLKSAIDKLKLLKPDSAMGNTQAAQEKMKRLSEMLSGFNELFKKRNLEEVMSDFQKILANVLQISKFQESINREINGSLNSNETLNRLMIEQNWNLESLSRTASELVKLSNKTFAVSPKIGRYLGMSYNKMNDVLQNLEERNTRFAERDAKEVFRSLNNLILELFSSMEYLSRSGQASGFEEYLRRLKELAQQQQTLNQQTMNLGLDPQGNQLTLRQIAARQAQIKKSLEKLQQQMRGNPNQVGDLSGIAKDMEEVIKELEQDERLKKIIQRQQKILTRMLDAQKSLRTQGYKKERKSRTGRDIVRESPSELPQNLGERDNFLKRNLEEALSRGYNIEYEKIVQRYFDFLLREEGSNGKK
ncbi:MAG: hypothetical protein H0Z29_00525 [Candidatus Marinimicrobia bacterium]|nr:hypothetical protein [Candidatus Neomarinimicrobiota bacterium]